VIGNYSPVTSLPVTSHKTCLPSAQVGYEQTKEALEKLQHLLEKPDTQVSVAKV
jgi:hypothetical protein